MLVRTEELEEIISYALLTGYLKDETPASLLIIAEVESGKSELAKSFADNKGVVFPHDLTAYGIAKHYGKELQKGQIRHIIFPEFVHCLVRQRETVKTLLAFLNGLIAEGVQELHTFRTNLRLPQPINCGIICCLTSGEFDDWRNYWEKMGFLSRVLPVTYSYSRRVEDEVFESIFREDYSKPRPVKISFPPHPVQVKLSHRVARRLNPTAKQVGNPIKIRGFRPQMMLQKMVKARAISEGRDVVLQEDVRRIRELADTYMNFNYTEIG